jgi:hypothetical protein
MKTMGVCWVRLLEIKIALLTAGMVLSANVLADTNQSRPFRQVTTNPTFIAEKYLGKYEDLEKTSYTTRGSIGNGSGLGSQPEVLINAHCRSFLPSKSLDCVFALIQIKERDMSGRSMYSTPFDMIHIKLPKGWNYFDSGDTACLSDKYPNADIVAIGQWAWRKKPLLGGYAHSLKKAWRIDYQAMRFVEIPIQGVTCGFNDDRD